MREWTVLKEMQAWDCQLERALGNGGERTPGTKSTQINGHQLGGFYLQITNNDEMNYGSFWASPSDDSAD
jgi:hypothetical protein